MLTQARLKELLHYDLETGVFVRRETGDERRRGGERAGRLNAQGYRQIKIDGTTYQEHRVAWLYMTGDWPKDQIDHANRVCDDNKWANLREATAFENTRNRGSFSHNTSGVKGVNWSKHKKMWQARIQSNGKSRFLGYFRTLGEAREVAELARVMIHGEFACHGAAHG